jgi:hypothetical protein
MLRKIKKGDFLDFLMYFIHHCFIYRVSDFNVSVDAGIKLRTVATLALAVRHLTTWLKSIY